MSKGLWFLAGALVGLINLALLRSAIEHLCPRGAGSRLLCFVGLNVLRLFLVLGVLALAAWQQVVAVLYAFGGLWLVRWPLLYLYMRKLHD